MGPLALPLAGLVYLDAIGLIYSVEQVEPYRTLLEPMWQEAQDGNLTIVSSPVLVVEALVKPLRDGNTEIEMQYRELFGANAVRLLEASYVVSEDAARLRAETGLAIPTPSTLRQLCALAARSSSPTTRTSAASKDCLSSSWMVSLKRRA